MKHLKMKLNGDRIRFTPDGKVAVVDAIKALSAKAGAEGIWRSLKEECPKFKDLCRVVEPFIPAGKEQKHV
jgi:hypothetical protein